MIRTLTLTKQEVRAVLIQGLLRKYGQCPQLKSLIMHPDRQVLMQLPDTGENFYGTQGTAEMHVEE